LLICLEDNCAKVLLCAVFTKYKIFLHYTDIVIFVLGHFILAHPVYCRSMICLFITLMQCTLLKPLDGLDE